MSMANCEIQRYVAQEIFDCLSYHLIKIFIPVRMSWRKVLAEYFLLNFAEPFVNDEEQNQTLWTSLQEHIRSLHHTGLSTVSVDILWRSPLHEILLNDHEQGGESNNKCVLAGVMWDKLHIAELAHWISLWQNQICPTGPGFWVSGNSSDISGFAPCYHPSRRQEIPPMGQHSVNQLSSVLFCNKNGLSMAGATAFTFCHPTRTPEWQP